MKYNNTDNIKTLYHWVRDDKAKDFVLKKGIVPDRLGFIYLSEKPLRQDGHIFLVAIPDNMFLFDWREFWVDGDDKEYDPNNPYYVYVDNTIPPEYLKLLK